MSKTMKEQNRFIFDMDGTLYRLDKGQSQTFAKSRFRADFLNNAYSFYMNRVGLSLKDSVAEHERISERYDGEVSLGLEAEYGIDRYDFFANTWNLDPEEFVEIDKDLPEVLHQLKGRVALLTAAPRIWAISVLAHLGVESIFDGRIYTGEPDERKPNPRVFQRIADDFSVPTNRIFSIGDQEHTDIVPARTIGMKTVLVGPSQDTVANYRADNVKLAIGLLKREGFV